VTGLRGLTALLLCLAAAWPAAPQAGLTVTVSILDQANRAAANIRVQLKSAEGLVSSAATDQKGHAEFTQLSRSRYEITVVQDGFETLRRDLDLSNGESVSIEWTMIPSLTRSEKVEVRGTVTAVGEGGSVPKQLPARIARELPSRPATVTDALPLIPGVIREPGGGVLISASPEHRSALIVNSADVTDPATGQFGLTVPIDSVETLNVYQTPYLAEFGRFTAGLVSVETRRGGDKWKWELNDPLPEFRIRSYHLRGLKDATPRLNFEGPIVASKLYLSEGFEYEVRRTAVYTLPFPYNQKKEEGINSFTQLDWIVSDKQLVTATVHIAPRRLGFVNMDYFNPPQVSPDASTHNYTSTVSDRLTLHGGVLENVFSLTRFDAAVWGQGSQDLIMTPLGNQGNYFAEQNRDAYRFSGATSYSFAPFALVGTHHFKIGSYIGASSDDGHVSERPIDILDSAGRRTERITFPRISDFEVSDVEYAVFGQDQWVLSPGVSVDLGVRTESQQVLGALRVAPRAGIAFQPFPGASTIIRSGFGLFYDRVPLNVYAFNRYPDRVVTDYGPDGGISGGPFLYLNTLGQSRVRFPFIFQRPVDGNFSPWSSSWSVQVEQPLTRSLRLRVNYMRDNSSGLAIMNTVAPDPATNIGAFLLEGAGQSRYQQFEATARLRVGKEREVFFSYVHSRARGDLNDFGQYLGTFPVPVIRGNQFSNLPGDVPHRLLAWGVLQLPWAFRIAPVLEYRNGFPYISTDAAQNYAGVPNQNRFPAFLSLDSRVSRDFKLNPKYAVRLSVSSFNLTNHFNPEAVHSNVADPAYGFFFGHRGRRFTADFDVLF
jgi:Carboxypeptidase regulatory-like domain